MFNRALDRGNPNPGAIGSDFNRLGLEFWPTVIAADARAAGWRNALDQMNVWRNAIAHHDYDPVAEGGIIVLTAAEVRGWRGACSRLARLFDRVMDDHLAQLTRVRAWPESGS